MVDTLSRHIGYITSKIWLKMRGSSASRDDSIEEIGKRLSRVELDNQPASHTHSQTRSQPDNQSFHLSNSQPSSHFFHHPFRKTYPYPAPPPPPAAASRYIPSMHQQPRYTNMPAAAASRRHDSVRRSVTTPQLPAATPAGCTCSCNSTLPRNWREPRRRESWGNGRCYQNGLLPPPPPPPPPPAPHMVSVYSPASRSHTPPKHGSLPTSSLSFTGMSDLTTVANGNHKRLSHGADPTSGWFPRYGWDERDFAGSRASLHQKRAAPVPSGGGTGAGGTLSRLFKFRKTRKQAYKQIPGDLTASEITMSDDDRIQLMILVKEGKLSMHDAVEAVKRYELERKLGLPPSPFFPTNQNGDYIPREDIKIPLCANKSHKASPMRFFRRCSSRLSKKRDAPKFVSPLLDKEDYTQPVCCGGGGQVPSPPPPADHKHSCPQHGLSQQPQQQHNGLSRQDSHHHNATSPTTTAADNHNALSHHQDSLSSHIDQDQEELCPHHHHHHYHSGLSLSSAQNGLTPQRHSFNGPFNAGSAPRWQHSPWEFLNSNQSYYQHHQNPQPPAYFDDCDSQSAGSGWFDRASQSRHSFHGFSPQQPTYPAAASVYHHYNATLSRRCSAASLTYFPPPPSDPRYPLYHPAGWDQGNPYRHLPPPPASPYPGGYFSSPPPPPPPIEEEACSCCSERRPGGLQRNNSKIAGSGENLRRWYTEKEAEEIGGDGSKRSSSSDSVEEIYQLGQAPPTPGQAPPTPADQTPPPSSQRGCLPRTPDVYEETSDGQTPKTVQDLCQRLGIQSLLPVFLLNGFETVELFRQLEAADLDQLGVTDPEQRAKVLTAATLLPAEDESLRASLRQLNLNHLAEDDRQGYSVIGSDAAVEASGEATFISAIEDSDGNDESASVDDNENDNTTADDTCDNDKKQELSEQSLANSTQDTQKDVLAEKDCGKEDGNKNDISVMESAKERGSNDDDGDEDEINGNLDNNEQKCDSNATILQKSRDSGCYMCIGEDSSK